MSVHDDQDGLFSELANVLAQHGLLFRWFRRDPRGSVRVESHFAAQR